jgi:hypothetical protein
MFIITMTTIVHATWCMPPSCLVDADVRPSMALQVAWKNHLHMLHPSPVAYAAYMGDVAM